MSKSAASNIRRGRATHLQVRRVLEHLNLDLLAVVVELLDPAQVADHVAGRAGRGGGVELGLALDLGKEAGGAAAEERGLSEEVEAAAVGEGDDDRLEVGWALVAALRLGLTLGAELEQCVKSGEHALGTLAACGQRVLHGGL